MAFMGGIEALECDGLPSLFETTLFRVFRWSRKKRRQAVALQSRASANSQKFFWLVLVRFEALITDETNGLLRCRIRIPLKGKLLTAVVAVNAKIPAAFDPLDEHLGDVNLKTT